MRASTDPRVRSRQAGVATELLPNAGIYATSADLSEEPLTPEHILCEVEKLNPHSTVPYLAALNVALGKSYNSDDHLLSSMASDFLGEERASKLRELPQYSRHFCWTTPWHLRVLISMCLQKGSYSSIRQFSEYSTRMSIGRILLSIGDVMRPEIRNARGELETLSAELHLHSSGYRPLDKQGTMLSMRETIVKDLTYDPQFSRLIEEKFGFTALELHAGLTSLWATFGRRDPSFVQATGSYVVHLPDQFGMLDVPKSVGDFILREFCHELRPTLRRLSSSYFYDPSFLVDRPLARVDDESICCLDLDFLFLKMCRGLWNLHPLLGPDSAAIVGDMAGRAFEKYCGGIFEQIVSSQRGAQRQSLYQRECDIGNGGADALYREDHFTLAVEYKSGPLKAAAAFGTDAQDLAEAIEKKYLKPQPKASGFPQIAEHLKSLLKAGRIASGDAVRPCLIVEDDAMTCAPAYTFASHNAEKYFASLPLQILEPLILHVDDLWGILERSKVASVREQMRAISKASVATYLSVKGALVARYPGENIGDELVLYERPNPMLDQIVESFRQRAFESVSSPCDICGSERISFRDPKQDFRWYCYRCNKSSEGILTPEEAQEIKLLKQRSMDRYFARAETN